MVSDLDMYKLKASFIYLSLYLTRLYMMLYILMHAYLPTFLPTDIRHHPLQPILLNLNPSHIPPPTFPSSRYPLPPNNLPPQIPKESHRLPNW